MHARTHARAHICNTSLGHCEIVNYTCTSPSRNRFRNTYFKHATLQQN